MSNASVVPNAQKRPRSNQPILMRLASVAAAIAAPLLGCTANEAPQDLPDDRVWESEHFRYHTRQDDPAACQSVLVALERHFALIRSYLGFEWTATQKIDYFKFRDIVDFRQHSSCPSDSASCVNGTQVLSPYVLQDHELIHAYVAPLGLPPSFFVEGLAVAMSCGHAWAVNPRPWRDVIALPYGEDRVYLEGPWFVADLLQRHGPEPLLMLYSRLGTRASLDEISSAFEAVYGQALDDAWNDALATSRFVRCVYLWECAGAKLELDGSRQSIAQACDGSDDFRTFEVDSEQDIVLDADGSFVFSPLSCNQEAPQPIGGDDIAWVSSIAHFVPGSYFIAAAEVSASVAVRSLPSAALSPDCSELEAADLTADEFSRTHFELTIPNDGRPWFAKLRPVSGRELCLATMSDELEVEECAGCGDATSCKPLDCASSTDDAGDVLLRLTPLSADASYLTATFAHRG